MNDGLCQCGCGRKTRLAPQNSLQRGWIKDQPIRFVRGHNSGAFPKLGLSNYREDAGTGCWLWQGSLNHDGYGVITISGKTVRVHRAVWERVYGQVPPGKELDHLCRNPRCVNPDHLEAVPPAVNTRRGRGTKLIPSQVDEIRRLRGEGGWTYKTLADRFGVGVGAIRGVLVGLTWKQVGDD
jgi:hypothetical protein